MSRPEFPTGIVLPVAVIFAINEKQRDYDRDPEAYERRQRERRDGLEQDRLREEDFLLEQYGREYSDGMDTD